MVKLTLSFWISCHLVQSLTLLAHTPFAWIDAMLVDFLSSCSNNGLSLALLACTPLAWIARTKARASPWYTSLKSQPIIIMAIPFNLLFILLALAHSVTAANRTWTCDCTNTTIKRSSFPDGVLFGAGVSAYQTQGAYNTGGKGSSIFDNFEALYPERMADDSCGKVAIDGYHRCVPDVQLVRNLGLDVYGFSISWSRILPRGQLSKGVNQFGIDYYNALIDELVANGLNFSPIT